MSIQDNERLFKSYVSKVYFALHDGVGIEEAKRQFPFPELSEEERRIVYAEASRHIAEVRIYLRREANQWLWWGAGFLSAVGIILTALGEPKAGRHIGIMWFMILCGIGLIGYGIFRKIKPL